MALGAAGQHAAFETLVRRHQQRLRAYCARWCGSGPLGDDVAQECFVELWQRRGSYQPQGKLKSYLFRIAASRCKNQQRALGRQQAAHETSLATATERRSDRLLLGDEKRRLQHGLDQLPELQKEAVLLRYAVELDYAEIASLLDVPEATVRSRVFLGLVKLRRLLRQEKRR